VVVAVAVLVVVLLLALLVVVGGADRLAFDLLEGIMTVRVDPASSVTPAAIVAAVERAGLGASQLSSADAARTEQEPSRNGPTIAAAASVGLTIVAFGAHAVLAGDVSAALGSEGMGTAQTVPLPVRGIYLVAILIGASHVVPKAVAAVRRLRPDMNLLMALAVVGAIALGEWLEAAVVSALFALSLALEAWSVGRARRAIRALLDLSPPQATILREGGVEESVVPTAVAVGDRVLVRPAERIPIDGEVLVGTSHVNQAPITGESIPVRKEPGAEVFTGTINGDGVLEVRCTRPATDTTLARIVRMVGEAQSRRSPSERWVESFAQVYTPVVLAVALLLAVVPPLAFGAAWAPWVYRGLVLLVIGCPCALVISTPVSVVAALAAAARHGVLIKGGEHIETPARLQAIALDKTGTITEGRPEVTAIEAFVDHGEKDVLEVTTALESRSDHPLAQAIVRHARGRGVVVEAATEVKAIQGKGLAGTVDGRTYWLGSHRYLEERKQETPEIHARLEALSAEGNTVVVLGTEDHVCGLVAMADRVRPESVAALKSLREVGIQHLVLLTGDNAGTARAIAKVAALDEVHAELMPADKVTVVERLVGTYGVVAMVGDGVNDAPALARASLGIAMGGAGSDAAIETADVTLMSDDLSRLPWLIHHSRRTVRTIRQNVAFALAVKGLSVVLTLAGVATLWLAIAADMGASLLVIANGLRLLGGAEPVGDPSPRRPAG
jgi:Zn2+/Cd2+-exporting ATPase